MTSYGTLLREFDGWVRELNEIPHGSLVTPVRELVKIPCGSSEHAPVRDVVETPGRHALSSFKKVPDGGPA